MKQAVFINGQHGAALTPQVWHAATWATQAAAEEDLSTYEEVLRTPLMVESAGESGFRMIELMDDEEERELIKTLGLDLADWQVTSARVKLRVFEGFKHAGKPKPISLSLNKSMCTITSQGESFSVASIVDDIGFAMTDMAGVKRIDVFPTIPAAQRRDGVFSEPKHAGPTVQLFSGPMLTAAEAREYAIMLEAAAYLADTLTDTENWWNGPADPTHA